MKNLIFSFLMLILSAGTIAFGQVSDTEIANAIRKAKEVNRQFSGIEDPNDIYPGQTVWVPVEVKKGDTQWFIFRDMFYSVETDGYSNIEELQPSHNPFLQPEQNLEPKVQSAAEKVSANVVEPVENAWLNESGNFLPKFFFFLFLGLLAFLFFYALYKVMKDKEEKKKMKNCNDFKFSSDPTKEGPAFVEGGIKTEEDALEHFIALAVRDNPNVNPSDIIVKKRKRVYISTLGGQTGIVHFANGTTQELAFRNVLGWQAMVSVDGGKSFQRELFFADCGNPIYGRTSMIEEGLIVTDEPISFGDEVTDLERVVDEVTQKVNSLITELEKEDKKTELEKPVVVADSESFRIQNHQLSVIENLFEKQRIHKVTHKVTYPDGSSAEVVIETKNDPAVPKE